MHFEIRRGTYPDPGTDSGTDPGTTGTAADFRHELSHERLSPSQGSRFLPLEIQYTMVDPRNRRPDWHVSAKIR